MPLHYPIKEEGQTQEKQHNLLYGSGLLCIKFKYDEADHIFMYLQAKFDGTLDSVDAKLSKQLYLHLQHHNLTATLHIDPLLTGPRLSW